MMIKQRYAVLVEYDGTAYAGWQRQPFLSATVQEKVESALSKIAAHPIETICAGRTDAGVHGIGQIIHFDTSAVRDSYAWLAGSNTNLPQDIRLQQIIAVDHSFHARYSALSRNYRYIILNSRQPSALARNHAFWHPHPLDVEKMQQEAQNLIGEHDFSSFRASECQSKSANRFISLINISRQGDWVALEIQGNAFLHHMVRNITGSLLMVGDGRRAEGWLKDVLHARDRRQAGPTAPAHGLYFYHVQYPEKYAIPIVNRSCFPL